MSPFLERSVRLCWSWRPSCGAQPSDAAYTMWIGFSRARHPLRTPSLLTRPTVRQSFVPVQKEQVVRANKSNCLHINDLKYIQCARACVIPCVNACAREKERTKACEIGILCMYTVFPVVQGSKRLMSVYKLFVYTLVLMMLHVFFTSPTAHNLHIFAAPDKQKFGAFAIKKTFKSFKWQMQVQSSF